MNRIVFIVALILFAACNGTADKPADRTPAMTSTAKDNSDTRSWTGTIRGNIPVFMHFALKDSVLAGELVYLNSSNKKPIRILGHLAPSMYMIKEFSDSGLISGTWSGTYSNDSLTGQWYGGNKEFSFSLLPKDTSIDKTISFTPGKIDGTYRYQYPKEGGMGEVSIKQLDAAHIIFNASCITGAPAYHMATVEDDTIAINNYVAQYENPEFGNCKFSLHFFNGFLVIQTAENAADCGFGMGAGVDGIYIKTSPTFNPLKTE